MRKILIITALVWFCTGNLFALNGSGTPADPWLIESLADFHEFAGDSDYWDDNTCLQCDLNLAGITYSTAVIAPDTSSSGGFHGTYFTGGFNGNGHRIYNLKIDVVDARNDYLGLFGKIFSGEIHNLGIVNMTISNADYSSLVGCLAGSNSGGLINNCYTTGNITGVTTPSAFGGLVGSNSGSSCISNCYSTCDITGGGYYSRKLGGLVGVNYSVIINCYATGNVTGGYYTTDLGGLVGYNTGYIKGCYFLHPAYGGGPNNGFGQPLTPFQMRNQNSFVGWDFVAESTNGTCEIWQMLVGGFPVQSNFNGYIPPTLIGAGTEEDPVLISNPDELGTIYHYELSACYRLDADIELTGISFSQAPIPVFYGVFDGNKHRIDRLTVNGGSYLGLFGTVRNADIRDFGLKNVNIISGNYSLYLGSLVGHNRESSISNCYTTGIVSAGEDSQVSAGLVGKNYYGSITNCYFDGSVFGGDNSLSLGGLVGSNDGIISNCYATGSVTGGDNSRTLGGLCGSNYDSGIISKCYITGSVTSGIGSGSLGGLCGNNRYGSISDCYFLDTAGPDNGYGTPLDDSNMMIQSSFVGWDFVGEESNGTEDHWQLCIDGYDYPRLTWQFNSPADFLQPGRVDHYDLFVLTQDWLSTQSRCGDIAPVNIPDSIVNLFDYQKFSEYWLYEILP